MILVGLTALGFAVPANAGVGGVAPPTTSTPPATQPPVDDQNPTADDQPSGETTPDGSDQVPTPPAPVNPVRDMWRGVIQGAYAVPWTAAERARLFEFMKKYNFNAYFHAPKDDPYQRTNWRVRWPAKEISQYLKEYRDLRKHGIQWIPSLSPGKHSRPSPPAPGLQPDAPICFSCPEEVNVLVEKFRPFLRAGARTFLLSLDDSGVSLVHAQDIATYGADERGYGLANADLLNRLDAALKAVNPRAKVIAVPAHYHGVADTPYLQALRERLSPNVELMWTGSGSRCCGSSLFSSSAAKRYSTNIGRTPIVWENWVNNDIARSWQLRISLGPYVRPGASTRDVRGFVLNAMNEPDLNMLPFGTFGLWAKNPRKYAPYRDWLRVAHDLAPDDVFEHFRAFAEVNYSTKLNQRDDAPTFNARREKLLKAYTANSPRWTQYREELMKELNLVLEAQDVLKKEPKLKYFRAQARRWFESAERAARTGVAAVDLLSAERPLIRVNARRTGFVGRVTPPDPARAARIKDLLTRRAQIIAEEKYPTYGNRRPFVGTQTRQLQNSMDRFVLETIALDAEWQLEAEDAASLVTLKLGTKPVKVAADGSFTLDRMACGKTLTAEDGAGNVTQVPVPPSMALCGTRPTDDD